MEDYTNTFCTVENLKAETALSSSVNPELIQPFINTAEIFWLKDTLGVALWSELKDAISGDTLSGNNYTLVENYIIPASCWFSYYEASTFIIYRGEAKGFTKKFSDNSTPIELKEFQTLRHAILDKAQTWRNMMIDYLTENQTDFPNWKSIDCSINSGKNYSGGFLI